MADIIIDLEIADPIIVELSETPPVLINPLNVGPAGKDANVLYGTGDPPDPAGLPNATIYFKYIP
jgi:hypothetical protein